MFAKNAKYSLRGKEEKALSIPARGLFHIDEEEGRRSGSQTKE